MQMEALQTSPDAPLRFKFSSSPKNVQILQSSLEADAADGRPTENTGHHPTDTMENVLKLNNKRVSDINTRFVRDLKLFFFKGSFEENFKNLNDPYLLVRRLAMGPLSQRIY